MTRTRSESILDRDARELQLFFHEFEI